MRFAVPGSFRERYPSDADGDIRTDASASLVCSLTHLHTRPIESGPYSLYLDRVAQYPVC